MSKKAVVYYYDFRTGCKYELKLFPSGKEAVCYLKNRGGQIFPSTIGNLKKLKSQGGGYARIGFPFRYLCARFLEDCEEDIQDFVKENWEELNV